MWGLEPGMQRLSATRTSSTRASGHHQTASLPTGLVQACPAVPVLCRDKSSGTVHAAHFTGQHADPTYSSTSELSTSYLQDSHSHQQLQDQPVQHAASHYSSRLQPQYRPALTPDSHSSWELNTTRPADSTVIAAAGAFTVADSQHVQEAPHQLELQPYVHIEDCCSARIPGRQQQQQRRKHRYQEAYHHTQQLQQASQQVNEQQQHQSSFRNGHKRPGKHKHTEKQLTKRSYMGQQEDQVASKQLTAAISSSSTWQQLHHLLLQDQSNMNHIHACALLSTTSKLVHYCQLDSAEQQQFAEFYIGALQLAFTKAQTTAGPREISSMLWAVAKVGLHPGPDWLAAFLQAAAPHVQQMNAQDIGLLLWSLARFKHVPDQLWQQQLLATTQQKMNMFDAQGSCNMLWGLAVLGIQPSRQWLAAAVAAVQRQWSYFQPQGLATVVWAVARLGCRVDQGWLRTSADAASRQLHSFKPAEIAMFCHAWAKLHAQPSSSSSDASQQQHRQQFLQQVQDISTQSVHRLSFVEAANMVWALGVLNQQPQQQWLAAVVQQLRMTMQHADGKALANVCYGFARMQQSPDVQFWEAVWQQIPHILGNTSPCEQQQGALSVAAAAVHSQSGTADSQAVATLLLSLSKLGVSQAIPSSVAAALLNAVQQQLQQQAMNGAEVVAVAMAVAKCKLRPQQQWCEALELLFLSLVQGSLSQSPDVAQNAQQHWQQQQQPAGLNMDASAASRHGGVDQDTLAVAAHSPQVLHDAAHLSDASFSLHSKQRQQRQQRLQERQLLMKPKEVSNTLLSLARLRYIPSEQLLEAVQLYQQRYGHLMNAADQQQLAKALQSIADQRRAKQQQEAQAVALQHIAAAAAAEQAGSDIQLTHEDACEVSPLAMKGEGFCASPASCSTRDISSTAAGATCTDPASKHASERVLCIEQHVNGNSSNSSSNSRHLNSSSSSDDRELQPYGRYILYLGHENGAVRWQGAPQQDAAAAAGGGTRSSSRRSRSKALVSVVQQALLVTGGLSAAVS